MTTFAKTFIKSMLRVAMPGRYDALMAARADRHGQRIMQRSGVETVARAFVDRYGLTVQSGPFMGMNYIEQATGSSFVPKLVGSYEAELHDILRGFLMPSAPLLGAVVDVGCAEGYYAVGLARYLPGKPRVLAFDINPEAQGLCNALAEKNGIRDHIEIEQACDPARLQEILAASAASDPDKYALVVCDCEGYELELLNPSEVSALSSANILVELHDWLRPGITPTLVERFGPTHDIQIIDSVERTPGDYPCVAFLPEDQQNVAVSEFRPGPQQWAFMRPLASANVSTGA
jgi:SAM-dependent methyltransferase